MLWWRHLLLSWLRFHTVTAGRGSGKKLMLLVHGFPELWYSWRWQLEAFKEDYEVVAFDLRGYGQTEKPKVLIGTVAYAWAAAAHCWLSSCEQACAQHSGCAFAFSFTQVAA
jgi:pimeloyl-ACP methyl ester carboxylesterase